MICVGVCSSAPNSSLLDTSTLLNSSSLTIPPAKVEVSLQGNFVTEPACGQVQNKCLTFRVINYPENSRIGPWPGSNEKRLSLSDGNFIHEHAISLSIPKWHLSLTGEPNREKSVIELSHIRGLFLREHPNKGRLECREGSITSPSRIFVPGPRSCDYVPVVAKYTGILVSWSTTNVSGSIDG